ncbi:MAG: hypothetical protein KQ78_01474 [Candidatus Izimaplasma bacterium HR2]|nr:MAG: hypothetical protein KQ78_01474 [Candidatus Izimaplasma bacterium HR2]
MTKENTFQDKIKMEMKNVKRELFHEEIRSVFFALGFASNVACMITQPLSILILLNCFFVVFFLKLFKPTVKKQFVLAKHMDFLRSSMKEKVWTPKD